MDGNTRLCTATAAAAMKESFGCGRAARQLRRHRRVRRDLPVRAQHGRDADGAVGAGAGPARRPDRPLVVCVDPRDDRGRARRPTCTSPSQPGTNLALMNGLIRELFAHGWIDDGYVAAHTARPRRAPRRRWSRGRPRRSPRSAASPPTDVRRAAEIFGTSRAGALHGAAGLLPVVTRPPPPRARSTTCTCCAGMIGRPGLRHPADERPADRAEQPRVRRRRRPARLPQLGEPRPRRRAGRGCGTSTRWSSRTGRRRRTPCRSSATSSRGRSSSSGSRPPTRRCRMPRAGAHPRASSAKESCSSSCRTSTSPRPPRSPTSCCRPPAGARRPARSPTSTAPSTCRSKAVDPPGEARSDLDIFLDYARRMGFRDP